jgi:hypothetical protein
MRRIHVGTIAVKKIAMVFLVATASQAIAQEVKTPYPNMAPVEQYLMGDREAEIALARSAAPESISRDAEILVLGRHGYETAVKGKNGFVCIVERVFVQREMECGRAPLASIPPICERHFAVATSGKGGSHRNGNWFQEKGSWRSRSQQGGAGAENQLAKKRKLNIRAAERLKKPHMPAASRWRIPAAAVASGVRCVSVSG